ncbi:M91 family zinc metallopeptidase [Streptomyces olivoreticuli]|uniref:M91 family zinc metallopeptidase n=1 Tax=Streptomyces olivoreticuli TaxID=68246 RepID=UPI0013C2A19D|nr:M91 family zinc metallopeptidase [Streptomyces olivoreticuli]
MPEAQFLEEINDLLGRIEQSRSGRSLLEFFGQARPIPDDDGGFGPPHPMHGMNTRSPDARDSRGRSVPTNVLIVQSTTGKAGQHSWDEDARSDGRGAFSMVIVDPRKFTLFDDVALPPELTLAHELIHAAHALSGTLEEEAGKQRLGDMKALPGEEDDYATHALTVKDPKTPIGIVKRLAKGTEQDREKFLRNAKVTPEMRKKLENAIAQYESHRAYFRKQAWKQEQPVPVAESPDGSIELLYGITYEEYRTHGNQVALAWIDGAEKKNGKIVLKPSRRELASDEVALGNVAAAARRAAGRHAAEIDAAVSLAYAIKDARLRIRGITEVRIASELNLRTRVAYDTLTGWLRLVFATVPRSAVPDQALHAHHLAQLAEGLKEAGDATTAAEIERYIADLQNPAPVGPGVVRQVLCTSHEESMGHCVPQEALPAALLNEARGTLQDVGNSMVSTDTEPNPRPGQGMTVPEITVSSLLPGRIGFLGGRKAVTDSMLERIHSSSDNSSQGNKDWAAMYIGSTRAVSIGYMVADDPAETKTCQLLEIHLGQDAPKLELHYVPDSFFTLGEKTGAQKAESLKRHYGIPGQQRLMDALGTRSIILAMAAAEGEEGDEIIVPWEVANTWCTARLAQPQPGWDRSLHGFVDDE